MDSARIGRVIFIAGGTIGLYFLVDKFAPLWWASAPFGRRSSHSRSGDPEDLLQSSTQPRGVHLRQVSPPPESETPTEIDIIAIHGFDTRSPDTWTWDPHGARVNWLEHPRMLPTLEKTRIFTCEWPADLFEQPNLLQKTIEEFARLLLAGIKMRHPVPGDTRDMDNRPIVFIASCLGGVVLMKALVMASHEYLSVKKATRSIVFLATPFQGTSFQNVAQWAEPGLRAWATVRNMNVSNLLKHTESSFELNELVRRFTALCREMDITDYVRTFYETGNSSLPRKLAPWLPKFLAREMPVVDPRSATLDIVTHPLPLDRPHILMNKFSGPDDPQYKRVADTLKDLLSKILDERLITKADVLIRNESYSLRNLRIERVLGEVLPMDQCYINLAIVESCNRPGKANTTEQASPFSLYARLKLGALDEESVVPLPRLFEPRKMDDGQEKNPNRILIRGQAGMGKTTLCKKIVYEFVYGTLWQGLFKYVLWIPLRNLKRQERRSIAGYNLGNLFYHEYFSQYPEGEKLASVLWDDVKHSKMLFILDGLDEVSGLDDGMFEFLKNLLDQQNVIITSRANAILPAGLRPLDLELNTIGFGLEEVATYIKTAFTNQETHKCDQAKVEKAQAFLQHHRVLQGLVRIPIQLDAFCSTWDATSTQNIQETMTAVYRAIEHSLWKKDLANLGKGHLAHTVPTPRQVEKSIEEERKLVEALAFTGMIHGIVDFELEHRDTISKRFENPASSLSLDDFIGKVSFLRTSDPSTGRDNRTYHFLHLTFQEYFAARYFVRQWGSSKRLRCLALNDGKDEEVEPATFLQNHKYDARYGILWRFVAGLLDAEDSNQIFRFFEVIQEGPRDLLGPTHQRLVMYSLSEAASQKKHAAYTQFRKELEGELSKWLLFECKFTKASQLACEMDFPEASLDNALQQATDETKRVVLQSIKYRLRIPSCVIELAFLWLAKDDWRVRQTALEVLRSQSALSEEQFQAVAARLEDDNSDVRRAAVKVLQSQSALSEEQFQAVAARLEDDNSDVRRAALEVLLYSLTHTPIPIGTVKPLFKALLKLSFREHINWRLIQNVSCITRGLQDNQICGWHEGLTNAIKEVQTCLYTDLCIKPSFTSA